MWSSDRRFVLLGLAALAGCGFRPVYGPGGAAEGLRGSVAVQAPRSENAYELVKQLELRLGDPTSPRFQLGYTIQTSENGVGITSGQETTRYHVVGSVAWTLKDMATGKVVASGKAQNFAGYGASGTTIATLSADEDAYRRLMVMLADQIVADLQSRARAIG